MSPSIFETRAHTFAEQIGDPSTKGLIELYLRQRDFTGPIVTFVGAENRGKTTLFSKAARVGPDASSRVHFAGDVTWKKSISEMNVTNSSFKVASTEVVGEILLCDAPAFGSAENDNFVSSLLKITDLTIMTVQITQPAGMDEVTFLRKHLTDIPSVLVLTKCDQADDDDFQEGLEAILENYGDFPWVAVLLSDLDGVLGEKTASDKVLLNFGQWWQGDGHSRAEEARQGHLRRLQQNWHDQSRRVLDSKEREYAPQLQQVTKALSESSSAREALKLQDDLTNGLNTLSDMALYYYRVHLTDLHRNINEVTHQFTDGIKAGREISQTEMEQALANVYSEWDHEARLDVLDKIKPTLEVLQQKAVRYAELIAAATHTQTGKETIQGAHGGHEPPVEHFGIDDKVSIEGDFDLTISDKLRTAALPTVSGLGAGMLLLTVVGATLFAPFAPLIAIAGGGIMGVGTFGSLSESNQQRRVNKLKEAIHRQTGQHERQLEQQLHSYWKKISDDVRDSVASSKRRLNILMMQQSIAQDSTLAAETKRLSSNMQKIASLRLDLKWLEEHEQSSKLVSDQGE